MPLQSTTSLATTAVTGPSAIPATPTPADDRSARRTRRPRVARFLARLEVDADLKNVQLQTSLPDARLPVVVSFTIVSDVRNGRGAS